ncbi:MAG TPA: gamma-glutamylcyclotransferase family protein [Candidatus Eisenbacteria bacterium]|nr:gamma-glutamylcyclotransferase family protein [Candidatus Eisenbacteria bacterium]
MPLLFSYGTLKEESVQRSTYGRRLDGTPDELIGFEASMVRIEDPDAAARLGKTHHANVVLSANPASRVPGMVFEITDVELARTDAYEAPDSYKRIAVTLASGREAWVYVHAR